MQQPESKRTTPKLRIRGTILDIGRTPFTGTAFQIGPRQFRVSTAHQQSSHGAFIFFARSFLGMDLALRFASLRSPIVVGRMTSCRASNAKQCI